MRWHLVAAGSETAPRMLNIGERIIAEVHAALQKKKFDKDIFQTARLDITAILRTKYVNFCNV